MRALAPRKGDIRPVVSELAEMPPRDETDHIQALLFLRPRLVFVTGKRYAARLRVLVLPSKIKAVGEHTCAAICVTSCLQPGFKIYAERPPGWTARRAGGAGLEDARDSDALNPSCVSITDQLATGGSTASTSAGRAGPGAKPNSDSWKPRELVLCVLRLTCLFCGRCICKLL